MSIDADIEALWLGLSEAQRTPPRADTLDTTIITIRDELADYARISEPPINVTSSRLLSFALMLSAFTATCDLTLTKETDNDPGTC